ncbi:MAG: FtsW/RodA/SpoVE family cell cycle protein, partial [Angustibacter sp.]
MSGFLASGRARRTRQFGSVWLRLDWSLVVVPLALSVLGGILVYSATKRTDGTDIMVRHFVNLLVGLILAAGIGLVDYRGLRAYSPVLYVLAILGLVVVLSPLGSTINGSHSWIELPAGFSIQPSEFAKVALVVGLAIVLSARRDIEDRPRHRDVAVALILATVPMGLVLLQPDLGSALVFVALVVGVVAASGAPARWLVGLSVVGLAGIAIALGTGVLDDYQRDRLTAFTDPSIDPRGIGYQ